MSDPPRHLISQVEYARLRGWSKQYVGQLVAKGRIPLVDGMVDPTAADAALAQHYDPGRSARFRGDRQARDDDNAGASDPDGPLKGPFAKARTVREHFRAMREKLEYEQLAGSLVSRSQIEGACFAAARAVRDLMIAAAQPAAVDLQRRFPGVNAEEAEEIILQRTNEALAEAADRLSAVQTTSPVSIQD